MILSALGRRRFIALFIASLLGSCRASSPHRTRELSTDSGDLIIVNAKLRDRLTTVRIASGRVVSIDEEPGDSVGARVIDARGGLVLPGFHDSHIHLLSGGISLGIVSVSSAKSVAEVRDAVSRFAADHPDARWVFGRGWDYGIKGAEKPSRQDLDGLANGRPIVLESYDGHALWVSSSALAAARIGPETADPEDGTLVREADGKTPSGLVLEGAARLIESKAPPLSTAEKRRALDKAFEHCLSLGVTSVDDLDRDRELLDIYRALDAEGALPLRVSVGAELAGDLEPYREFQRSGTSPMLQMGYLKGFVDGVIESKTAFMLEPYEGSTERGRPLIPEERLRSLVRRAHENGFRVSLHAIGDGAVRLGLDAFSALDPESRRTRGHRIEHIEVISVDDLPRFAELGVIASMQPFHANPFGDNPDDGVWAKNLGPKRLAHSFAHRELLDAGAHLVFGSDWPVMSADPLKGIAVALTRRDRLGRPADGWHPEQTVDLKTALAAYREAPLEVGSLADLVVLAPGIDPSSPSTLWSGDRVAATIVDGVVRFERKIATANR